MSERRLIPGQHYEPEQLLVHRPPMLLLDAIADYGAVWNAAEVRFRENSPFLHGGQVPAWVGIEYMAQAAAAWAGIESLQHGRAPSLGFLLGTRQYRSQVAGFELGMDLLVRARLIFADDSDLAIFECAIHHNGELLAQAEVKAYRPQDVAAFLGA